jgi:hypothetical protein
LLPRIIQEKEALRRENEMLKLVVINVINKEIARDTSRSVWWSICRVSSLCYCVHYKIWCKCNAAFNREVLVAEPIRMVVSDKFISNYFYI